MKTTKLVAVLGAVLFLFGCDDGGDPGAAMMPAPDAGSGGAAAAGTGGAGGDGTGGTAGAGSGGAAGAPSGSGGTAGAGTGGTAGTGGVVGTGGVQGSGGTAGAGGSAGTGGTGGAPVIPVCEGTVRMAGDCFNLDQTGWKKKNGYDCNINCSTIAGGTNNIGPPAGPECIFGGRKICVRSCSECQ